MRSTRKRNLPQAKNIKLLFSLRFLRYSIFFNFKQRDYFVNILQPRIYIKKAKKKSINQCGYTPMTISKQDAYKRRTLGCALQ